MQAYFLSGYVCSCLFVVCMCLCVCVRVRGLVGGESAEGAGRTHNSVDVLSMLASGPGIPLTLPLIITLE